MKRSPWAILLILGLCSSLILFSGIGWLVWENRPSDQAGPPSFKIHPGEPLVNTAQNLQSVGLVRNALVFRVVYQFILGDKGVPSGTFAVPSGMTSWEAANYFRKAQPLQIKVTVPEGWTAGKIARLLEERQVVDSKAFLKLVNNPEPLGSLARGMQTLEGKLFPDTYLFPVESTPESVASIFLRNYRTRKQDLTQGLTEEETYHRLVLASIVEREYRVPDEAPLIASVFQNRLDRGIPLGSCATIEYILTEIQGRSHPKRIFFVHTEIPSPYNTYLNKGLPPAPISNPGMAALNAVFRPHETNYLYFVVADPAKGTHTFSSNYSKHEQAREVYLRTYVTKV